MVAPDLIGFAKSDKLAANGDYSYARHVGWMRSWVEQLDLTNITLVCQDWGSLVGLRLVAEMPDLFAAIVLSNGGLPEGGKAPLAFSLWRAFAKWSPVFPIGKIVSAGTSRGLSANEIAAYDSPFPNASFKSGARIFPSFVPFGNNIAVPDQKRAWAVLDRWIKPILCCFGNQDRITRGGENRFIGRVPGTQGLNHRPLNGGHFIQEDDPATFVECILETASRLR